GKRGVDGQLQDGSRIDSTVGGGEVLSTMAGMTTGIRGGSTNVVGEDMQMDWQPIPDTGEQTGPNARDRRIVQTDTTLKTSSNGGTSQRTGDAEKATKQQRQFRI
ncbi:hypothetical protein J6590_106757, partial [Homalodisca vitripennis]